MKKRVRRESKEERVQNEPEKCLRRLAKKCRQGPGPNASYPWKQKHVNSFMIINVKT